MNFKIHTTTNVEEVARFLANSLLEKLKAGKKILFFATGGSSIAVCVSAADILRTELDASLLQNLTITLTDERYGEVGHQDSNWEQLTSRGLTSGNIVYAKSIPVLVGKDFHNTILKFDNSVEEIMQTSDYKIGLFGVGKDGHTAGILPESISVSSEDFVCGYETPTFFRITITPKTIENLDEAVVFMQGEEKWNVLEDLEHEIDVSTQPAQVLKKVPLLNIFTDRK